MLILSTFVRLDHRHSTIIIWHWAYRGSTFLWTLVRRGTLFQPTVRGDEEKNWHIWHFPVVACPKFYCYLPNILVVSLEVPWSFLQLIWPSQSVCIIFVQLLKKSKFEPTCLNSRNKFTFLWICSSFLCNSEMCVRKYMGKEYNSLHIPTYSIILT